MVGNSNTAWNSGNTGVKLAGVILIFLMLCGQGLAQNRAAAFPDNIISDIQVKILGVKGDTITWESTARSLFPFKSGDVYTPEKIQETITILSESRLFEKIEIPDPGITKEGVNLIFILTPFGRIKDIRVKGAFPIFRKEVMNVMGIYNGDAFSEDLLSGQTARVEQLFKKEGYLDPKVTVTEEKDERDGHYKVLVQIEKGDFYRIKTVTMDGNLAFSDFRLKLRTNTWKSSLLFGSAARFTEKHLGDDVKNLIKFYRQQGFADVAVTKKIQKNEAAKTMDIHFLIEEGPLYRIGFEGNNRFWDSTLKKELTLSREGNKGNIALKKSRRNIQKKYAQAGYMDSRVQIKPETPGQGKKPVRDVTLLIHEGQPYIVSKIVITGHRGMDEKRIRKQILTQPSGLLTRGGYAAKTLEADINAIKTLYLTEGYTRARVEKNIKISQSLSPKDKQTTLVEIEIIIDEGVQSRVGTVDFKGLSAQEKQAALTLITLKPGQVFRDYMIKSDEITLKKQISEKGFPHIQVTGTASFHPDRSRVDLFYEVEKGDFVTLGQIFHTGNFRTKDTILHQEMVLSTGEPLSLTRLLESQRNMMNMGAIDSVRFRTLGLKEKSSEVDLVVEVDEKRPYFFEIGTGYDTERHFYGNTSLGDHNFLGRNHTLEANIEVSQIGFKGDISHTEPRFFATRISSTTKLAVEKREEFNKGFGLRSYSLSQNFHHSFLSETLAADLGVKYEFREQYETDTMDLTLAQTDWYDPRNIFVTSPSIIYRTTDSFVRPRKGVFLAASADISKGIDNTLDDYVKYRVDARYYHTLFDPLTFAVRARYGYIQPYGKNNTVPEDQLFFLGGTSTVRGFDENMLLLDDTGNALGGREAVLGSIEARYDVGMNLEVTAFYDTGRLQGILHHSDPDDFRSSVGLGLRYMTPIGPIGLLYGWKLDPQPGESSGSLHFSMGYTF